MAVLLAAHAEHRSLIKRGVVVAVVYVDRGSTQIVTSMIIHGCSFLVHYTKRT